MTLERAGRVAWIAPVLAAAFAAVYLVVFPKPEPDRIEALFGLTFVVYAAVGALIAARRPRNPVGWLFCTIGMLFAGGEVLNTFLQRASGNLDAWTAVAWAASWSSDNTIVVALLVLLFPTGRFLSPGWRRAALVAVLASVVWAVAIAVDPGPLRSAETIENPLGIDAAAAISGPLTAVGAVVIPATLLLAVCGVVARFRRARGVERRQLKWLALATGFAVAVFVSLVVLSLVVDTDRGAGHTLAGALVCAGFAGVPVAAAIAILRERLYDVDVAINRALVYGALTATLGGVYLGIVLLAGLAVGDSDLAVAASTLAVAALFRPARARIQAGVDRRFYRRRYDARRTLAGFGARLRDELDLEALGGELRGVVRETVQPAHVSLWLRRAR